MSRVIYLLRKPVDQISPTLYPRDRDRSVVFAMESGLGTSSAVRVVDPGNDPTLRPGQILSYSDLLAVVLQAEKIITL
jgi:hypothetical protein